MSADPPLPADKSEEISVVIRALREADLRLEELTAGEVDSVMDREGRSFLLRRAQDQLRESEAAKQAAILDALPAHIALLDVQGVILSVNERWGEAGGGDTLRGPAFAVGLNYLDICDAARGSDAADAQRTAAGIRSVLAGADKRFMLEYVANALNERRRRHARRHHGSEARQGSAAALRCGHGRHLGCDLPGRSCEHAIRSRQ
jgi:hypothetical protein